VESGCDLVSVLHNMGFGPDPGNSPEPADLDPDADPVHTTDGDRCLTIALNATHLNQKNHQLLY